MSLTRRLQVLIDEDQYQRLTHTATAEGCSVGSLIRRAIDLTWSEPDATRMRAAESVFSAALMPVPELVADLRQEIGQAHSGRFT